MKALEWDGRSMPCPGHFTPRKKIYYPLYGSLGEPSLSGWVWKILAPLGFES